MSAGSSISLASRQHGLKVKAMLQASEKTDTAAGFKFLKTGSGGFYSEVTADTQGAIQMRTRGISVVRPAGEPGPAGGTQDPQPIQIASDTCLIVSQP